jgi:protein phosphatase
LTKTFLKNNNLDLFIRSHQMVEDGFMFSHDDKLLTIFSASNYCGIAKNYGIIKNKKGCIAEISDFDDINNLKIKFIQYKVDSYEKIEKIDEKIKNQTLNLLKEKIFINKSELHKEFLIYDQNKKGIFDLIVGYIKIDHWRVILKKVLKLKIDWSFFSKYLLNDSKEQNINYIKFLQRYQFEFDKEFIKNFNKEIISDVCMKIFINFKTLKKFFQLSDIDNDNRLSFEEISNTFKKININLTDDQIFDFVIGIDTNFDGFIDFKEFESRFNIKYKEIIENPDEVIPEKDKELFDKIGNKIVTNLHDLNLAFEKFDINHDSI